MAKGAFFRPTWRTSNKAPQKVLGALSSPDAPMETLSRIGRATRRQDIEYSAEVHPLSGRVMAMNRGDRDGVNVARAPQTKTNKKLLRLADRTSNPVVRRRAERAAAGVGPKPISMHSHPYQQGAPFSEQSPIDLEMVREHSRQKHVVSTFNPDAGRGGKKTRLVFMNRENSPRSRRFLREGGANGNENMAQRHEIASMSDRGITELADNEMVGEWAAMDRSFQHRRPTPVMRRAAAGQPVAQALTSPGGSRALARASHEGPFKRTYSGFRRRETVVKAGNPFELSKGLGSGVGRVLDAGERTMLRSKAGAKVHAAVGRKLDDRAVNAAEALLPVGTTVGRKEVGFVASHEVSRSGRMRRRVDTTVRASRRADQRKVADLDLTVYPTGHIKAGARVTPAYRRRGVAGDVNRVAQENAPKAKIPAFGFTAVSGKIDAGWGQEQHLGARTWGRGKARFIPGFGMIDRGGQAKAAAAARGPEAEKDFKRVVRRSRLGLIKPETVNRDHPELKDVPWAGYVKGGQPFLGKTRKVGAVGAVGYGGVKVNEKRAS